ncbi:MAG: hypothetical protein J6X72_01315, partial [Clostridia bacterium]|nr:hypothetical protein [Clostridia bacterium]
LIRKILLRMGSSRSGKYSQIVLSNAGIRLGVVDDERVTIDFDGGTVRTLNDVFNIDEDGDGVADYLQNLPDKAKVYYESGTVSDPSIAEDSEDTVSIVWTDSAFLIDPTGGKTETIAKPKDGSDTIAITYNLIGTILNYNRYIPLQVPYSAIRLVKYTTIGGKKTPLIKGDKIQLPLRITPDKVKDLDDDLPKVLMVYLTDGYGQNGMYYTFDGREVGGNVVEWDWSDVSDSYEGGEYTLKLTFGDGKTKNYHIDVPITVIPQPLTRINGFTYSDDEKTSLAGGSLTFDAGIRTVEKSAFSDLDDHTVELPDRDYAEFGTTGNRLYEIRWVDSEFTAGYAGATYYADAYIGNSEIGYHRFENIPIVFKNKLIESYDLNTSGKTYTFEFDPYVVNETDGKPEALSLHSYPQYVNLQFQGEVDEKGAPIYHFTLVEWNFENIVNTYEGSNASYATFRYGDEYIGYQYVKVPVKIKERIFTSSMLRVDEMDIITTVDPLHLKSDGEIVVAGLEDAISDSWRYDYDPT